MRNIPCNTEMESNKAEKAKLCEKELRVFDPSKT